MLFGTNRASSFTAAVKGKKTCPGGEGEQQAPNHTRQLVPEHDGDDLAVGQGMAGMGQGAASVLLLPARGLTHLGTWTKGASGLPDAVGCFCPPRKLPNQVGSSSWRRGKKTGSGEEHFVSF